jgi:Mn-dependent DtxR family transcriptional regulator
MQENEIKIMKILNKASNGQISEKDLAEKLKIKCPILRSYIHDLRHKRHIKYSGSTVDGHIIELTREGKELVEKI